MRTSRRLLIGVVAAAALLRTGTVAAQHACDDLGETGWKTVATIETVDQADGPPVSAGPAGNWFVERTTTVLPFCNYYNSLGNYSLRSYSLSPEVSKERIEICRANSAVPPYAGTCPPKAG